MKANFSGVVARRFVRNLLFGAALAVVVPGVAQAGELDFLFQDSGGASANESAQSKNAASQKNVSESDNGTVPVTNNAADSGDGQQAGSDREATATVPVPSGGLPGESADTRGTTAARVAQTTKVQEIIVTARRRKESLAEVPVSIAAFTGDMLENLGISGMSGLETAVPGMMVNSSGGFGRIYIRGFGTNAFVPFVSPTVGVFIDGAYAPAATSALQYLGNVKSVSVLKGPQGTYFGRNTTAGAVNIHTAEISEKFHGEMSVGIGDRDARTASIYLSGPIFSNPGGLDAGIALGYFTHSVGAHQENTFGPTPPLRDTEDEGFFAKLMLNPLDWLSIRTTYIHNTHNSAHGSFFQAQEVGLLNTGQPCTTPRHCPNNLDPFGKTKSTFLSSRATATFDSVEWWFQASQTEAHVTNQFDGDGTGADELRNKNVYFWKNHSFQSQLSSNGGWSIFGMPVEWMVGVYRFGGTAVMDPLRFSIPTGKLLGTLLNVPIRETLGQIIDLSLLRAQFQLGGYLDTEATGYFANTTIDVFDWLSLNLGIRYSKEERTGTESTAALRILGLQNVLGPGSDLPSISIGEFDFGLRDSGVQLRDTVLDTLIFENVSTLVGLGLDLPYGNLLYLRRSEGFKAGTWNLVTLLQGPSQVPQETVVSKEVGFKGQFFDNQLKLTLAAFEMDFEGLQVYQVALIETGSAIVRSIDKSRSRGVELGSTYMFQFNLLPGDSGRFRLSAAYLDADIVKWPNAPTFDRQTYIGKSANLSGNQLHNAPDWTVSANLGYGFNIFGGDRLSFGVNYYYNSGFFFDPQNFIYQSSYSLLGARVSYEFTDWNLTAALQGENLADTSYRVYGQVYDFGEMVSYSTLQEWKFTLSWDF